MRILRATLVSLGVLVGALLILFLGVLAFLLAGRSLDGARQARRLQALRSSGGPGAESSRASSGLPADLTLRLDQIQLIGTHNSYHLRADPLRLLLIGLVQPGEPEKLRYAHAPLYDQLSGGVRSVELDVRNLGGRFIVSHVPLVDDRTTCPDFSSALEEIRLWSERTPGHVPLIVILELKEDWTFLDPRLKPFDRSVLDRLDAQIGSAFPRRGLITPDDVRGSSVTLEAAILERGWPLLRDVRGRVMFVLHENEQYRRLFTQGNPTLAGRTMFTCAPPGAPDAAVRIMNDPVADGPEIRELVRRGYLVRTRADADLSVGAAQLQAALSSGAHVISTDFPPSEPEGASGYTCAFPGGTTARVRPAE